MSSSSGSAGKKPTPTSSTTGRGKAPMPVRIAEESDTDGDTPMEPRPTAQSTGAPPPYSGDARIQALETELRKVINQLGLQRGDPSVELIARPKVLVVLKKMKLCRSGNSSAAPSSRMVVPIIFVLMKSSMV